MDREGSAQAARNKKTTWIMYGLIALILEKIVQHVVVTIALYRNIKDIRSTVAVSPDILMIAGGVVAILFALSFWGMIARKKWAINLVLGLALFDMVGEFVAQGKIMIVMTVSFLVATILLVLSLLYRRI